MLPVLNAFLDDGGEDIVVIEQSEDGPQKRRVRAEYTTYHRAEDLGADLMRMLKGAEQVTHVEQETETWTRIGWRNEYERRQARFMLSKKGIETFEGDVSPVRYWLTQTRAAIAKPRRCYLDIETDSRVAFANKEQMRVLCWAVSDDTGPVAKGVLAEDTDESEERLLQKLWGVLDNYDQVCAWYGGDPEDKDKGFDFYVIAQRTHRCGLPVDTRRWLWLDQLVVWRRMNQAESGEEKESFRLEDIAQNQVGEGKEKTPDWVIERFGNKPLGSLAWELWAAGGKFRKLLVDYCVKDTELLRKLEARKGFITLFQSVCEATAVFGNTWGLFPTGQMDGFCLRLGRDKNYRFATKRFEKDDGGKGFEGAFVLAPRTVESPPNKQTGEGGWTKQEAADWRKKHSMLDGILRNIHVCDFASLYPSNIITWNLSEDVLVDKEAIIEKVKIAYKNGEQVPDGYCYSPGTGVVTRVEPHGILTIALRELVRLRKFYADEAKKYPPGTPAFVDAMAKSTAYKVVANSFYGVAGAKTSRFFNRNVARSTTQNGVWLIKNVMKQGEVRKIESIAGDTDSSFAMGTSLNGFDTFVKWLNEKYLPKEIGRSGAKDIRVKLEFEKTFDILVFTGKKRYIGRFLHYKWKSTCNHCKSKDGKTPGAVDIRTLTCLDCGHKYDKPPVFIGKPEIKGLEYRRGDQSRLAREMQGQVIDMLVGGLHVTPEYDDVERPIMDVAKYEALLERWRDRILNEPLKTEDVRIAKTIKDESEYKKKDDGETNLEPQRLVAKILESRGQTVTIGSKVDFVVVDGASSPMKVIPAEDFNGECDRYYLWDTMVFPPTLRLLQSAFPEHDWARFEDVRPKKAKTGKKVSEDQLGLSFDAKPKVSNRVDTYEVLAVQTFSTTPLVIRVPEVVGVEGLNRLKKILKDNPGPRSLEIVIALNTGHEAILRSSLRVATGAKLRKEVEALVQEYTAS